MLCSQSNRLYMMKMVSILWDSWVTIVNFVTHNASYHIPLLCPFPVIFEKECDVKKPHTWFNITPTILPNGSLASDTSGLWVIYKLGKLFRFRRTFSRGNRSKVTWPLLWGVARRGTFFSDSHRKVLVLGSWTLFFPMCLFGQNVSVELTGAYGSFR